MTITRLLSASALAALVATPALGQGRSTPPPRPIPYSQLDAYLDASPRERQTRDWWAGAQTGAATDASATSALVTDQRTGAQIALPPSTSPAMEAGPMSNGATAATAAEAGTLSPSGAQTGAAANTATTVPGPNGASSATSGTSNSQVGQGEAGEATSGGTTTPP